MKPRAIEYVVKSDKYRARLLFTGARLESSSDAVLFIERLSFGTVEPKWEAMNSTDVSFSVKDTPDYSKQEIQKCVERITQLELENKVLKEILENK